MDMIGQYLISKDNGKLQIPYNEYTALVEKMEEAKRIEQVKSTVLANLQGYLDGQPAGDAAIAEEDITQTYESENTDGDPENVAAEKVSVEFSPEEPEGHTSIQSEEAVPVEVPPVKKDIEDHFNSRDGSGRLLNVFKQYYTCLNESCRGIVRVTLKDGICSLWNYDEWEEFAFIDVLDDELRIAVDARYTDDLSSLNICEVARLLAARRSLIAVQVGDLNKTMLGVLTRAFEEVGQTAG